MIHCSLRRRDSSAPESVPRLFKHGICGGVVQPECLALSNVQLFLWFLLWAGCNRHLFVVAHFRRHKTWKGERSVVEDDQWPRSSPGVSSFVPLKTAINWAQILPWENPQDQLYIYLPWIFSMLHGYWWQNSIDWWYQLILDYKAVQSHSMSCPTPLHHYFRWLNAH